MRIEFVVKCLYYKGKAFSEKEITGIVPFTGNLVVATSFPGDSHNYRVRRARLLGSTFTGRVLDLIPPLLEPELMHLADGQMKLHGYQIHVDEDTGTVRKYEQEWLIGWCET